jgi:hypothetical protein
LHGDAGHKTPHRRLLRKKNLVILEMRRHYTNYLKGLPNIREYRTKLVTAKTLPEIDELLVGNIRVYDGFAFEPRKVEMDAMAYSCG